MNRNLIFALLPWFEVFVKTCYWRSKFINKILARRIRKASRVTHIPGSEGESIAFELIAAQLLKLGVRKGGIAIIHSSSKAIKPTGLTPAEVCEKLLDLMGPKGTLAMPAFPIYRGEPTGPARLTDSYFVQRLTYDVRRTPPWTGALPRALMGFAGAIRSRHPLNSMVAVGPMAEPMMAANIEGDRPKACGPGSSWKFCADRNASVVCLGVDTAHSLTMIHVAEDCADHWPIPNWYRDRMFHIKDGEFETEVTVRERRPRWAINYGERRLQRDLIDSGIVKVGYVGDLRIEVCESELLIEFLNQRNAHGYPYWFPFWDRM